MYALMCYQSALLTKCLITHIKYYGAHHNVCVDAFSDCSDHRMPYYILHSCKGAHHYVCVDVLPDCPLYYIPYYTLHSYTHDHHYACVDVLSDASDH